MRWRRVHAVGVLALALVLAGCVADSPSPDTTPIASAAPLFATEEEALAAATEAYAAYLAVSDAISADGGANPERIADVVSTFWLPKEMAAFGDFASAGVVQVGTTSFDTVSLQALDETAGLADVTIYACTDSSATSIRNSAGLDVTPSGRVPRFPLLVSFVSRAGQPTALLFDGSATWDGADFCN